MQLELRRVQPEHAADGALVNGRRWENSPFAACYIARR